MSKYSHFEMCEKIFGDRYKWDEHKQEYTLFTRSDMWDKLVEQQQQMAELQKQLEETKQTGSYQIMLMCQKENILLKQQLKSQPAEIVEKIRNLAEKDFDFDTCTCCGEDVHDDVVLPKSDFNETLDKVLKEYQK